MSISPFMGEYLLFDGQRKGTKRKATRMLALRVPCDARMSWRCVNSTVWWNGLYPQISESIRQRPTHGAAFLWFCFFYPYKRNELAYKGRKARINSRKRI